MAVVSHAEHHGVEAGGQLGQPRFQRRQALFRRFGAGFVQRDEASGGGMLLQQHRLHQPCVGAFAALRHPALVDQGDRYAAPVQRLLRQGIEKMLWRGAAGDGQQRLGAQVQGLAQLVGQRLGQRLGQRPGIGEAVKAGNGGCGHEADPRWASRR
ncbi:hypothetical protein RF55_18364 [Lasius niger]|uniref:Uncharacterized protein n=1 Tax=Lasius niger TaxID=67767 RepID=A0A0J7K1D6_LASNI|nr:hypothetical protein RF55_18364 [Lasius niger]